MIKMLMTALLLQVATLPPAQAEERLLSWAAADFRLHSPGQATAFRNVYTGWLDHPEGARRLLLCGEVMVRTSNGSSEWAGFATLETRGGYEQWLGRSAGAWCNAETRLDTLRDLSGRLAKLMEAAR